MERTGLKVSLRFSFGGGGLIGGLCSLAQKRNRDGEASLLLLVVLLLLWSSVSLPVDGPCPRVRPGRQLPRRRG